MSYKPQILAVADGGTGANTLTGLVLGNGTSAMTAITYTSVTSWTPTIAIGGSSTGITYSTQNGKYYTLGNLVIFWFNINLSSLGGLSGTVTITNMPIATGVSGANIYIPVNFYTSWTATANYTAMSLNLANSSQVGTFYESAVNNSAAAVVTAAMLTNTSQFATCGSYIIG